MFRKSILPIVLYVLIASWIRSWRYRVFEPEQLKIDLKEKRPIIFAHWHGDEVSLMPLIRPYRTATMTSTSKDGELMNSLYMKLGGVTSRGSSTRGAVGALKGLLRLIKKEGRNASIAVDGPKGPLHKVKPGVFELARVTGAAIYCSGVAANNKITFEKAWNKAFIAKPFTKVAVHWSGPYYIDKSMDPRDPELQSTLEQHLHEAHVQATKIIANNDA